MNALQQYEMDVRGYVVLRAALARDAALRIADEFQHLLDAGRLGHADMADGSTRITDFLRTSPSARGLLDQGEVRAVLDDILGEDHRLDHAYAMRQPRGTGQLALHGGSTDGHPAVFFESSGGKVRSGLTVVSWALVDQPRTSGGFVCIPGSHHATGALPGMRQAHAAGELLALGESPDLLADVDLRAGDALVFTEALCHGARPWRQSQPRWSLLFKYAPRSVGWATYRPPSRDLEASLTPRQRLLLAPPDDRAGASEG